MASPSTGWKTPLRACSRYIPTTCPCSRAPGFRRREFLQVQSKACGQGQEQQRVAVLAAVREHVCAWPPALCAACAVSKPPPAGVHGKRMLIQQQKGGDRASSPHASCLSLLNTASTAHDLPHMVVRVTVKGRVKVGFNGSMGYARLIHLQACVGGEGLRAARRLVRSVHHVRAVVHNKGEAGGVERRHKDDLVAPVAAEALVEPGHQPPRYDAPRLIPLAVLYLVWLLRWRGVRCRHRVHRP